MASVLTAYSYFKLFRACIYFLRSLLKLSSMDRCNDTKCSVLLQDWCYVIRLYCKWCWSVAHHYWPRFLSDFKKSDNLQNNMLGRWVDGRNDSSTKRLMVEVLFFSWFLAKFFAKILSIYFLIFYKITKMKIKSFECPKSERTKQMEEILNFQKPSEGLELVILLHTQY